MTLAGFSGSIIEFAIGNLAIALPVGLGAWWLQRGGRQPFLAHLLWLVVLIKLVTPPIYSLEISQPVEQAPNATALSLPAPTAGPIQPAAELGWLASMDWQLALAGLWLAGSAMILVWSMTRAIRFNRLLCTTSATPAAEFQRLASVQARALGIKQVPDIRITAARISPMVWWVGGQVRIYIPESMVRQMQPAELADILAHELGHVKRGDHYVRWLECVVSILLWWNPIAWWARRNLRICEEICCDAFVISKTKASRDAYAGALISAMELLAVPTIRPSGLASHVDGGFIERRIRMILSGEKILQAPRWLRGLVLASAVVLLPLGLTVAQDAEDDLEMVRQWLESGVNSAFLTREQADIMLRAVQAAESADQLHVVVGEPGEIYVTNRRFVANGDGSQVEVFINGENAGQSFEQALEFARNHFGERVAAGDMTQQEADAIIEDMRNATEQGLAGGDGSDYYDLLVENGQINGATGERRIRIIRQMENDFNAAGGNAAAGEVIEFELVRTDEVPVEVEAD